MMNNVGKKLKKRQFWFIGVASYKISNPDSVGVNSLFDKIYEI